MINNCPGKGRLRGAPTLKEKLCPNCERNIEFFSNESQIKCDCGFIVNNDISANKSDSPDIPE